MNRTARWLAALMVALGAAAFAYGAWRLVSSALGELVGAIIVALEIAISLALYGAFRRKWTAMFGRDWPRTPK